jgi:hypothetical protein
MSGFLRVVVVGAFGMLIGLAAPLEAEAQSCPKDSVRSGSACIDKYEASVSDCARGREWTADRGAEAGD